MKRSIQYWLDKLVKAGAAAIFVAALGITITATQNSQVVSVELPLNGAIPQVNWNAGGS